MAIEFVSDDNGGEVRFSGEDAELLEARATQLGLTPEELFRKMLRDDIERAQ
jgi:hypothetical protein